MRVGVMLRHIDMRGGIGVYSRKLMEKLFEISPEHEFFLYYKSGDEIGGYGHFENVSEYYVPGKYKLLWDQVSIPLFSKSHHLDIMMNPKLSVPLFSSTPSIFFFHGPEGFIVPEAYHWLDLLQGRILMRRYARKAAATIVSTPDGCDKAIQFLGAPAERLHICPPGRDVSFKPAPPAIIADAIARHCIPERYFLFAGGLYPIKNFGGLLKALAQVRDTLGPATPPLVALGFNRWKMEAEMKLIGSLGLGSHVIFPGFVSDDDLVALFSGCRAFILPSLYEGFGLAVLEAMSCGAPVITSNVGGTAYLGGEGAALLIDPREPAQIADAMLRLDSDEGLRGQLSQKGLRRAEQFTWDRMAKQVKSVMQEISPEAAANRL